MQTVSPIDLSIHKFIHFVLELIFFSNAQFFLTYFSDVRNLQIPEFLKFMAPKQTEVAVKKPKRSIHQQDDGTIYAICATGASTKDSLLSWIRLLERNGNPSLAHTPVLFTFRTPVDDRALVVVNNSNQNGKEKEKEKVKEEK